MLDPQKIWQGVLGELELILSKANFTTWFKNTFIIEINLEKKEVVIAVPNAFTKSWMEQKYNKHILEALNNVCKSKIANIFYKIQSVKKFQQAAAVESAGSSSVIDTKTTQDAQNNAWFKETIDPFGLNPRYVFKNFVVGPNNQLAYSASAAIVDEPGVRYNPLFLYGEVGLGKTHLLHAIGHAALEHYPKAKVLCTSFEQFTNDFVAAARKGAYDNFRNLYRSANFLLIDDVQFMIDKEKTQEEFFHTFEFLHKINRQLVITSDRPPKALVELQDRMISRFEWGMIADIKKPDLETRVAILKNKCRERSFTLNPDIINYVAENIKDSIRELEGALNKIIAWYDLSQQAPTIASTREILTNLMVDPGKKPLEHKRILEIVAEFYNLALDDLTGSCRRRQIVVPRQIVMYLMREELKYSYPTIGQHIGDRDHTTVMHACQKISEMIEEEERIRQEVENIRQRLRG